MAKQVIYLGTVNNDRTGDGAKIGGQKINENFTELYDAVDGLSNVDNTSDVNKPVSTAQAAADAAIATQLIDGADSGNNTLKKLQDRISAVSAIVGGSTSDGDSIVNTVAELLAVFSTYPEGSDIVTLLSGKVNTTDVYNALDQVIAGKVLDARQGKVLSDLIAALTTASVPDSTDRRYVTDAQRTVIGNTSGTNSGNETTTTIGTLVNGATAKATPVDADFLGLMDSAASNILKKLSWANVKATLKTYFDTIYQPIITATNFGSFINGLTAKTTPVDADYVGLMDSEASNVQKKLSWANIKATLKTYFESTALSSSSSITAKQFASTIQTLTDAATITWDGALGQNATVTLGGNRTLAAITNPINGAVYILRVLQDGTGSRTLTLNAAFTSAGSITPYINLAASASTTLAWLYDGTSFRYILPSNAYRLGDLLIENQKATSGKKLMMYIDDTGKIFKSSWVEVDSTNQRITKTAVDDINIIEEWKSLSGNSVVKINADRSVEFGGTSAFWTVPSGIADGSAGIIFLGGLDLAYRLKDASSFDYLATKSSTTGYGRATIIKQKQVNNEGAGFETIRRQFRLMLPNTTAAAAHIVGSIDVASGYGISIHVLRAFAFATNGNAQSCEPFSAVGTNAAGTTSGTSTTATAVRLTATTGGFSIVFNNTTDTVDVTFTNETGTGRQYDVLVDVEYITYPLPV